MRVLAGEADTLSPRLGGARGGDNASGDMGRAAPRAVRALELVEYDAGLAMSRTLLISVLTDSGKTGLVPARVRSGFLLRTGSAELDFRRRRAASGDDKSLPSKNISPAGALLCLRNLDGVPPRIELPSG